MHGAALQATKQKYLSLPEEGLTWVIALTLLLEMSCRRAHLGFVSRSAALGVCEKRLLWSSALHLLREMLQKHVDLSIDMHHVVF